MLFESKSVMSNTSGELGLPLDPTNILFSSVFDHTLPNLSCKNFQPPGKLLELLIISLATLIKDGTGKKGVRNLFSGGVIYDSYEW